MKKYLILISSLVTIALVSAFLCGCGQASTTSSAPSTEATTEATTPATTQASTKDDLTLKIGIAYDLSNDVCVDSQHMMELLVANDNLNGGLAVGDKKYKVELVEYDTGGTQTGETAAINKLVFQDKVKYLFCQGRYQGSWLPVTEKDKVIVMSFDTNAPVDLASTTHYSFQPCGSNPDMAVKVGWFAKTYPDLNKKVVIVIPDSPFGQMASGMLKPLYEAFGVEPVFVAYPESQTDLSAVATKVVSMNPTCVIPMTGAPASDFRIVKTLYDAGYKGQFFSATKSPLDLALQYCPAAALEGMIMGSDASELASPPAATKEAMDLWTTKYGKWTYPSTIGVSAYSCLKAAVEKAGTVDTDGVSEVVASGLKYTSPVSDFTMISRPDLGNDRTVDSFGVGWMKIIKSGKSELLATIDVDTGVGYFRLAYPPKTGN